MSCVVDVHRQCYGEELLENVFHDFHTVKTERLMLEF